MALNWVGRQIINGCIGKISKAKELCTEACQSVFPAQEVVAENWNSESGVAMQDALNQIWKQLKAAQEQLAAAESAVSAQGSFIINNYVEDEEQQKEGC